METKSIATKLHELNCIETHIEDIILNAFKDCESEIYKNLDFNISSDEYDNSITICFEVSLPYPYEPCKEVREVIYNLGFSNVYWLFSKDTMDVVCDIIVNQKPLLIRNSPDTIRNYEPRCNRSALWIPTKYGYVDERFDEKEWLLNYNFINHGF